MRLIRQVQRKSRAALALRRSQATLHSFGRFAGGLRSICSTWRNPVGIVKSAGSKGPSTSCVTHISWTKVRSFFVPSEKQVSDYPTLQELVDKSFQIKKSSWTSSWH